MTSVVTAREITVFLTVIGVWARQNKTSWYPIIASLKTCLTFMAGFNTGSILPLIFNLVLLAEVAI